MLNLTKEQIIEYFRRSFTAVDGLWFMKTEERSDFDVALDLDTDVWKIMSKIQARMLRAQGQMPDGIDALRECLETKLSIEGFLFTTESDQDDDGFTINIRQCPWHDIMCKAGREKLSGEIGNRICRTEYEGWANEFGGTITAEVTDRICEGQLFCKIGFSDGGTVLNEPPGSGDR